MRIAISGAGVAGPTLAYWLLESGHEVLLVESAPELRRGGYIVDFWGLGYDVADRMGLIPRIREAGYQLREVRFVDRRGRTCGGFPVTAFEHLTGGRFTSLRRSDISAVIYGALRGRTETLFGDSIAAIEDRGDRVHLRFEHAAPREVDLVIGADGLHSRVRQLAFGPESAFERDLGYRVAAVEVGGYPRRDELVSVSHGAPGRQVSRFSMRDDRTLLLFVCHAEHLPGRLPVGHDERKAALSRVFGDLGWEVPGMLAAIPDGAEIYFDRVSQIRMDRWTSGRVALLGDAAACVSLLAGEGTGLAMAAAYVLAGELRHCAGDPAAAFARYQSLLAPFLVKKQAMAARFASAFAPRTALGLAFRNRVSRLLRIDSVAEAMFARDMRDDLQLPDYGFK